MQGAAERAQAGQHDAVGVGPCRRRHAGSERRCGQLVVGEQNQRSVQRRQLLRAAAAAPPLSATHSRAAALRSLRQRRGRQPVERAGEDPAGGARTASGRRSERSGSAAPSAPITTGIRSTPRRPPRGAQRPTARRMRRTGRPAPTGAPAGPPHNSPATRSNDREAGQLNRVLPAVVQPPVGVQQRHLGLDHDLQRVGPVAAAGPDREPLDGVALEQRAPVSAGGVALEQPTADVRVDGLALYAEPVSDLAGGQQRRIGHPHMLT